MPGYDASTALVVVDVQNDFADPAGSLYVVGGHEVVPFISAEIGVAVDAGAPIFYTQDWHPARTPHFVTDGGIWPVHCVQDSWGAELHPGLRVQGAIVQGAIVRKGSHGEDGFSGFTMRDPVSGETVPTELADLLAAASVTRLVLCGLATDYCVRATALDARAHGYPTTVLQDGIRAVDLQPGDGDRAVEEMLSAGVRLESRSPAASSPARAASD